LTIPKRAQARAMPRSRKRVRDGLTGNLWRRRLLVTGDSSSEAEVPRAEVADPNLMLIGQAPPVASAPSTPASFAGGDALGTRRSILPMNVNVQYWGGNFGSRSQLNRPLENIRAGARILRYHWGCFPTVDCENSSMTKPVRLLLVALVVTCLLTGGEVLYLDIGNDPMSYRSTTGHFDYQYAMITALMAGASLGPFVFLVGLVLCGIGYVFVVGAQLLLHRKR
jgi:hypothetical protein